MTENIIESTINEWKKRLFESPFWGSFIISWLLINWKVVYITISLNSISLTDKILKIEELYPTWNFTDFTHPLISVVVYPLLASFIAVAIIPIINHFYLYIRKKYRDWDATIEKAEIDIEKNLIQNKIALQREQKELIKEQKWVLEEKKEVISLENEIKKSIYDKIISNEEVKSQFIEMIQFIDIKNNQKDTINEALWLDSDKSFRQFSANDIVDFNIVYPIWDKNSKYFIFFTDSWKKIALQMKEDGYLKEEDLIGKI